MPRKSIWAQLCAVLLLAEARSTPEGTLKERLGRLIILAPTSVPKHSHEILNSRSEPLWKISIQENTPKGTEIEQLRNSVDNSVPREAPLEFRIVRQDRQNGLDLFEIQQNGELVLKQAPDRERLCNRRRECLLNLEVSFILKLWRSIFIYNFNKSVKIRLKVNLNKQKSDVNPGSRRISACTRPGASFTSDDIKKVRK